MKKTIINCANRTICTIFLISILCTNNQALGQCPEAPRNIEYSSNFYKAQTYFMEQNNAKSANLNVVIKGVPIGGAASSTNWSRQTSSLTEDEAINYIKSELSNYKAQIFAEATSVLCQISRIPNPINLCSKMQP